MFFWSKKTVVEEPKSNPERDSIMNAEGKIMLYSNDSFELRAKKIFYSLGFVNDRFNVIPHLAQTLKMYQDLDNEYQRQVNERANKGIKEKLTAEFPSFEVKK